MRSMCQRTAEREGPRRYRQGSVMKDPTILSAEVVRAGRRLSEAEEAEVDRLWDAVLAEGWTPGECPAALEQAVREGKG